VRERDRERERGRGREGGCVSEREKEIWAEAVFVSLKATNNEQ